MSKERIPREGKTSMRHTKLVSFADHEYLRGKENKAVSVLGSQSADISNVHFKCSKMLVNHLISGDFSFFSVIYNVHDCRQGFELGR